MSECRYCKKEVENNIKSCPFCGITNPTLKLKDVFIGIFILIGVSLLISIFT